MRYAVADTTNGVIDTYETLTEAWVAWREFVITGVRHEIENNFGDLTNEQIYQKVTSFYDVVDLGPDSQINN